MALDPAVASAVWGEGVGSGVACLCALGAGLPGEGSRRGPPAALGATPVAHSAAPHAWPAAARWRPCARRQAALGARRGQAALGAASCALGAATRRARQRAALGAAVCPGGWRRSGGPHEGARLRGSARHAGLAASSQARPGHGRGSGQRPARRSERPPAVLIAASQRRLARAHGPCWLAAGSLAPWRRRLGKPLWATAAGGG
jgi:hypothetical protein